MDVAVWIIALVALVTFASGVSGRLPLPTPLVLTVVGVAASYIPGVPEFQLRPEVVLVGFLPPLLYAAALKTSLVDFHRNRLPIGLLSVGLVIFTTVLVGLVVWWLLPVRPSVAFALGAVVAPPDAVAATSIARRVGMPRRMVTILEGEGLVNDATALVALRTAIAAVGGAVSVWQIGGAFVLAAVGGVVIGLVVAVVTGRVRFYINDDITDTAVSLITPFIAYLIAEELHSSGVLAVVVSGLIIGHRSHIMQSASSRIFARTNWATIQFLLENAVFLLIGLQVRQILEAAAGSDLPASEIVTACVLVPVAVMLVRALWVFPMVHLPQLVPASSGSGRPRWAYATAISWAGMRGVVTLAAAFILPSDTPHREILILVALVVVGATLLLQGSTLPLLLRRLGLHGPDAAEDALQLASVQQRVSAAGLARLDKIAAPGDRDDVLGQLRWRAEQRSQAIWEQLGGSDETPSEAYARLRSQMLDAERLELIRIRDQGMVADDVLRRVQGSIDIEETMLDRRGSVNVGDREADLTPPDMHTGCEHMTDLAEPPKPQTPDGCADCLAEGAAWVHLRLCMTCGHVGCCDSSVGKHGTLHFEQSAHPVIRSFEPGEAWRWCYLDDVLG
ncbi:MAG: Na+/H+ antiporter [Nocardioidaceae bacterium]